MASVASVNPGVADLLQAVSTNVSGTLSSALSASDVQSALQKASPGDLVKLSRQALQLQTAAGLFGGPDVSQTASDPGSLLLQAVNSSVSGSATTGVSGTTSSNGLFSLLG